VILAALEIPAGTPCTQGQFPPGSTLHTWRDWPDQIVGGQRLHLVSRAYLRAIDKRVWGAMCEGLMIERCHALLEQLHYVVYREVGAPFTRGAINFPT
jgi:hypothetical protein